MADTIDLGGRTYTAVHTDDRTLRVDSEHYDAGDGSCLDAARTGTVVRVDVGDAASRWPRFAAAATAKGIHSFLAGAVVHCGAHLGAFNLYGRPSVGVPQCGRNAQTARDGKPNACR